MAATRGERLHPRPLQPHRPQHWRHRHRGEKCRGAAHPERQDSRPRDRQVLFVYRPRPRRAAEGPHRVLSAQGREEQHRPRLPPPRAGRPQRDYLIPNAPDARRAVASGGRVAHGPHASDPREHGRPRPSPARRRQVRRRQREPQIWRNASGALLLPSALRLSQRRGHPRISARTRVSGG